MNRWSKLTSIPGLTTVHVHSDYFMQIIFYLNAKHYIFYGMEVECDSTHHPSMHIIIGIII